MGFFRSGGGNSLTKLFGPALKEAKRKRDAVRPGIADRPTVPGSPSGDAGTGDVTSGKAVKKIRKTGRGPGGLLGGPSVLLRANKKRLGE